MPRKKRFEIKSFYYITHINNLPSILGDGIHAHQIVQDRQLQYTPVYDAEIVGKRKDKHTPNNKSLWQFANLYFQPRNPMLYRVVLEKGAKDIAVLSIKKAVISTPGVYITDGNAAADMTLFYPVKEGVKAVEEIWPSINSDWWNSVDGSKRKIMAECLVPNSIPHEMIHSIYVADHATAERVRSLALPDDLPVIPEPNMFFRPANRYKITENLSLAEGDMFFSTMQTLTVSVNVVGIMGKGLASRAKYQFPDVYVAYQDACRSKSLRMGKPYLYKREASLDSDLADEPDATTVANGIKWFLLFATKNHWREDSDIRGIDEGLQWLEVNYKTEGIRSIALPALGCGLGNLAWKEVGPLMCRMLSRLDIPVVIYLPREREIPKEYFEASYLLKIKS